MATTITTKAVADILKETAVHSPNLPVTAPLVNRALEQQLFFSGPATNNASNSTHSTLPKFEDFARGWRGGLNPDFWDAYKKYLLDPVNFEDVNWLRIPVDEGQQEVDPLDKLVADIETILEECDVGYTPH